MTIDANLSNALSSGTRRDILDALKGRNGIILSNLAWALGKHVTTVKEHLQVLEKVGLVEKDKQPGRKFVFYSLSSNGARILPPCIRSEVHLALFGSPSPQGGADRPSLPISPPTASAREDEGPPSPFTGCS